MRITVQEFKPRTYSSAGRGPYTCVSCYGIANRIVIYYRRGYSFVSRFCEKCVLEDKHKK